MATTFEKLSSNKVKLGFEVAADKFEQALVSAYHKNAKRFAIPGFRKGKAPMKVIESFYGPSVFYEEAFDILFPEVSLSTVITALNFSPSIFTSTSCTSMPQFFKDSIIFF